MDRFGNKARAEARRRKAEMSLREFTASEAYEEAVARRLAEKASQINECLDWARSRIQHIEADERFKAKPADVEVNAPLALIQVQMETEHRALKAVEKILTGGSR